MSLELKKGIINFDYFSHVRNRDSISQFHCSSGENRDYNEKPILGPVQFTYTVLPYLVFSKKITYYYGLFLVIYLFEEKSKQ